MLPNTTTSSPMVRPTLLERLGGVTDLGDGSLRRSLTRLLNARRPTDLPPEVLDGASPFAYGLRADWAEALDPLDPAAVRALCDDIADTIRRHEPRLANVVVAPAATPALARAAAGRAGVVTLRILASVRDRPPAPVAFSVRVGTEAIDLEPAEHEPTQP